MTIHSLALVAHVVISATIILLVLLQRGKGADAGAAFGAGASGTVFGAKGSANFMSRSTAVLAALFFLSSLGLTFLGANRPVVQSLMEGSERAGSEITGRLPFEDETAESIEALPSLPDLGGAGVTEPPQPGSGEE